MKFLILGIVAFALFMLMKKRKKANWGFKDVVRDPEHFDKVAEEDRELNAAIEAASAWDDAQVASATRKVIFDVTTSGEAWPGARILKALGERTYGGVLKILQERNLYERLVNRRC